MNVSLLERVADQLRTGLADYEPERITGADAARMLKGFAEIEKLAAGGKLLSARRVESSNVWRREGHRSAAAHVAEATGTGMGPAIDALKAARSLGSLPVTDDAMRNGRLSETQVKEIAGAAILQPDAEQELVDAAGSQTLNVLRLRCRRVRATGIDQNRAYEGVHQHRYLRNWTDTDGAVRFDARFTPDEGARLVAAVKAEATRLAAETRRAGCEEPPKALAADALVRLACRRDPAGAGGCSPSDPAAIVHVRVDHEALLRGHLEPGEVCEIPGIGPIPVDVARRLAADSILSVLVTNGVDVTSVAHSGRTIATAVRTALIERDPLCVVPGCDNRDGLEIDHVIPFAGGGPTSLDNLARLCHWHHYLKTFQRYRLERVGDEWVWSQPDGAVHTGKPASRSG
ncbi:MAG: HNH endonuclease signature motif containing protein [Acidimicrobiales bacterium]